ncbi:ABC transporter substrate-binding protein [Clostridium cavendishii]|nr:ABC transporter substrate-binding protein [Clostridium cavendishii]
MKRKSIAVLSVLLASSVMLTACGKKADDAGKKADDKTAQQLKREAAADPKKLPDVAKNRKDTLVVGTVNPSGKFNPLYADTTYDGWVSELIFDGLLGNDEKGLPTKLLAKDYTVKDDKVYTFTLNDAKFSDGTEVTSDDVVFTYTALSDPKYDGISNAAVQKIKGFKEYNQGDAKTLEGVKAIDKKTVEITLSEVRAAAPNDFTLGIVPKHIYNFEKGNIQKLKDKFLQPVGCGPYKFKEFKKGEYVSFEKNDGYFRGAPKIPNIIMKVTNLATNIQELQAGSVDVDLVSPKPESVQLLKSSGFIDVLSYPANKYLYIGMNLRNDMFKDKKVRQALTYGLNRQGAVDAFFKGYAQVINTHTSPVAWAQPSKVNEYKYSADEANKLLDEAGWKLNKDTKIREKDGKKFEIHFKASNTQPFNDSLIPILKECYEKLGVQVIAEQVEFASLSENVFDKQNFEMYTMGWGLTPEPDPTQVFHTTGDVLGGSNAVGWHPAKSDELIEKGIHTTNVEERKKIYAEWMELLNEEAPYIFLANPKDVMAISSKVKNFNPSSFVHWTADIHKVEISE